MRTRIDIANCGAGPRAPSSISRSRADSVSIGIQYNPRMRKTVSLVAIVLAAAVPSAQRGGQQSAPAEITILKPARVFDGVDSLSRVVRDQIGRGADWIKMYADYRWGPNAGSHPT